MDPSLVTELGLIASELRVTSSNEAETRLKLIDRIIFELLGWDTLDVKVESRISEDGKSEFIDYLVECGNQHIIIEAKKIGENFSGLPKTRKASLASSWAKTGKLGDSIRQARDYGRKKGVGYCISTNGTSWVAFPINRRDGVTFEQSIAIVFDQLIFNDPSMIEEFRGVFSRDAVIDGVLDEEMLGSDRDQNENRRLNGIYDKTFSKIKRTSIFHAIEREIVTAFNDDLLDANPQLLEKCYVQTPERTRFDSRIQMYLKPREQVIKTKPIRPVSKKKDQKIVSELVTRLDGRSIALLTLGLVGAGKSTFLKYTSEVSAKGRFSVSDTKPSGCWIRVDFRDFGLSRDPRSFIYDVIFDYIRSHPFLNNFEKSLKSVYSSEIEELRTGPLSFLSNNETEFNKSVADVIIDDFKKREPYCSKILSFWAKVVPVFLVIDNVDQIESAEEQSKIFLEATSIARSLACNLILAMRDATYVKNRSSAVFDAFDFDAVYIDPPEILSVLSKRFKVAAHLLSDKTVEFESENGAKLIVEDATLIIEMLSGSVLGTEVGRIIDVAATGDTRLALQMTRQFLQHGYTSTSKAVEVYQRTGRYRLPPHEALRAIMLGNQSVYRESFSVIGNPFDAHLSRSGVQFLRIFVLGSLVLYSSSGDFQGIAAREIYELLERIGISRRDSSKAIQDIMDFRFIQSVGHQDFTEETLLVATRFGGFVVRELITKMMFHETVMYDTFIHDKEAWDYIKDNMKKVYAERDIMQRFNRRKDIVRVFFNYCENSVQNLVDLAQARALPPQWCSNPLTRIKAEFGAELEGAARSAERGQQRQLAEKDLLSYQKK